MIKTWLKCRSGFGPSYEPGGCLPSLSQKPSAVAGVRACARVCPTRVLIGVGCA
jgi:hypothetical protein